jgi:hypothetical protein
MMHLRLGKNLFWDLFKSIWLSYLFVKQYIGVFLFILVISKRILLNTSKALIFQSLYFKIWNSLVVKIGPIFIISSDIRSVMSSLWYSIMNENPFQFILTLILFNFILFFLLNSLLCIRIKINFLRKWTVSI